MHPTYTVLSQALRFSNPCKVHLSAQLGNCTNVCTFTARVAERKSPEEKERACVD